MTPRELIFLLTVWPAVAWIVVYSAPSWTPIVAAALATQR